jgi:hypothetical protein
MLIFSGDGLVSMYEAYVYARDNDRRSENPQYDCLPSTLGEITYLFGGFASHPHFVVSSPYIDDNTGDMDGYADPGEEIRFYSNLYSRGTKCYNVRAVLSSSDPYIELISPVLEFDSLDHDVEIPDYFLIELSESCPWGHIVNATVTVSAGTTFVDPGSYTFLYPVSFEVIAPKPRVMSYEMTFISGDGDDIWEPGESINLFLSFENRSVQEISGMVINLSSSNPYVTVESPSVFYGNLPSLGSVTPTSGYRISLSSSASRNMIAPFKLLIEGERGYSDSLDFALQVGNNFVPPVDLSAWDSDGWQPSHRRMINGVPSWYCGSFGDFLYPTGRDLSLTSCFFALPSGNPVLIFDQYLVCEKNFDFAKIQISADAGRTWSDLLVQTAFNSVWETKMIPIPTEYHSQAVKIRFVLESNSSINAEGWYISNVRVVPRPPAVMGAGFPMPFIGKPDMLYGFMVNYINPDNLYPTESRIVINGVRYTMSLIGGTPVTGQRWYYALELGEGVHSWRCEFRYDGGFVRFPETGDVTGPVVIPELVVFDVGSSVCGFTHSGSNDIWQWGVPVGAPSVGISPGTSVWGTNLTGFYPCGSDGAACRLKTPPLYHCYNRNSDTLD